MSVAVRKWVAGGLTAVAGVVALVSCGVLVTQTLGARERLIEHQSEAAELRELGQEDPEHGPPLNTSYEVETDAALAREALYEELGYVLLLAVAAFVSSAQWLLRLARPRPVLPRAIAARMAKEDNGVPGGSDGLAPCACAAEAARQANELDLSAIEEILASTGRGPSAAIAILQGIQAHYRYLPDAALRRVCELTDVHPAELVGVASFYSQFRRTPIGEHVISVCHGTACHVAGAPLVTDALRRKLGIPLGQDTDPTGEFTVESVPCLGCCTLAPVVQVDQTTHAHARPDDVTGIIDDARARRRYGYIDTAPPPHVPHEAAVAEVRLGMGSCCQANGSDRVHDALQAALATAGAPAIVKRVGCVGMCHQTPFIEIAAGDGKSVHYGCVEPEQVPAIVKRHFKSNGVGGRLRDVAEGMISVFRDDGTQRAVIERSLELRDPHVAAFLDPQKHIATEHCGDLDPLDLDEYFERDGFQALRRCLDEMPAGQIVDAVKRSGLRGRGGAGFPTWRKWDLVRSADGEQKYVVINGDEGDPGAFMDRMLMESYPYRVIEGVTIAALATGATEGYFYIRAEYPLAVERISEAIRHLEERGYLGDDILGSGRRLKLRVVQGAGAFVCGEETALIASIEGHRGMPTLRPPYPAQRGLWGRPTLVNNVETYTVLPWIMRHGPAEFAALGTERSKGTKVFSLTGKIARGGLIEVPMGITIREIVERIGGGIKVEQTAAGPREHTFKAVQIGGPSGGCVPARLADTPVDYEALVEVGAMMGSGGLVVLDETDCMVDIARYFLTFTQSQSCGKCTPCRVGTRRMLEILERLCDGRGVAGDLEKLEELAEMIARTSLCGLGKTAPNPVLTTLRYFREEYEAHLHGHCPAGRCSALIAYDVTDKCTGCTLCAQHCPADAIEIRPYLRHEIDTEKCTRCDVCRVRCPEEAIVVR